MKFSYCANSGIFTLRCIAYMLIDVHCPNSINSIFKKKSNKVTNIWQKLEVNVSFVVT